MNILIYTRPWNKDYQIKLIKQIFPNAQIITISDFKYCGDIWINKLQSKENGPTILDDEISDIILRCRFLRNIERQRAEKLASDTINKIDLFFDKMNFDCCYMQIPDCYTMDVICRIAKKKNIKVISIVNSFISGYSRFTLYGEAIQCRNFVSDVEVNNVKKMLLNDSYKPSFSLNKKQKKSGLYKYYIRRKIIQSIFFPFMKFIFNDYDNYHYNTCEFKEGFKYYVPRDLDSYFMRINEIVFTKFDVYLPLHYTPEATVDYWAKNNEHAKYEEFIIKFIESSDPNIRFIVKEHPAKYGKRNICFYKKLIELGNVILIHPYENSNHLLRNIYNILITTGSVGVEAILRERNVLATTENYYTSIVGIPIITKISLNDLNRKAEYDIDYFIRVLLKMHMDVKFGSSNYSKMERYFEYAYANR